THCRRLTAAKPVRVLEDSTHANFSQTQTEQRKLLATQRKPNSDGFEAQRRRYRRVRHLDKTRLQTAAHADVLQVAAARTEPAVRVRLAVPTIHALVDGFVRLGSAHTTSG
ncbi:MAG: hypothetical protein ACI8U4_001725, partial [Natronomonas sp.]